MKYISAIILAIILWGCYGSEPEKTGLEGKPIPAFKILLRDSITYLDTKELQQGKPIVLFYYGPHCPYSRAQMQEMMDNMSIMKNIQFVLITRGNFNEMKIFCSHYGIDKYNNITAGVDFNNFLGEYFKITGVPFTAVYDKDKKLLSAFSGKIFVKQIVSTVNL
jgi:hypothetical protein